MSRILSEAQKKAIFTNIPTSVTVNDEEVTASRIWANQVHGYPAISLNISNDGVRRIEDITNGILYYEATLTIHILTENTDQNNGAIVADAFSQAIVEEIATWTTPLTGDVRIFDSREDIGTTQNNGFEDDIYDYIISVTIYHG